MKLQTALIAIVLCMAGPAFAQNAAPASGTEPKPPSLHQSVTPAKPAAPASATQAKTSSPAAAAEKVDPAKDTAIRHLLDITEESKMGERMSNYITGKVREKFSQALPPDRMPKFMETFSQKFSTSAAPSAIMDAQVSVYAKHYSMEDIQALVQFYESPTGQHVVKAMPQISQETQFAGAQIDQKAALDVLREMSDEYTELKQILPPDNQKPEAAPAPAATPAPGAAPAPNPAPAPKSATAPPQR